MSQPAVSYNFFQIYAKSDTVDIPDAPNGTRPVAIYNGGAGNIVGVLPGGGTGTTLFAAVPVGILPVTFQRINSTSTTAGPFVALYQV